MGRLSARRVLPIGVGIGVVAALPYLTSFHIATEILIFSILATGFNLLLGYTGLFSWGQAIFFGSGAYFAGNLLQRWDAPVGICLLGGAAAGAVMSLLVGWFSTRTRGLYFILMTIALNQVTYLAAITWKSATGGNDGLQRIPRADLVIGNLTLSLQDPLSFYWFTFAIFLLCFYLFLRVIRSPLGTIFRAIKDNEGRVLAVGYRTSRYKMLSVLISGTMSGVAGSLYALQWGLVPISSIDLLQSSNIVFMSILGGVGHPIGPVIGAGIYIWLRDVISSLWPRWPIILGSIIILVVYFFRGGLMEGWLLLKESGRSRKRITGGEI